MAGRNKKLDAVKEEAQAQVKALQAEQARYKAGMEAGQQKLQAELDQSR